MSGEFQREERYIVIKRKQLSRVSENAIRDLIGKLGARPIECVVVEHDWPEYETVWAMIQSRVEAQWQSPEPKTEDELIEMADDQQLDAIGAHWHMEREPGEASAAYRIRIKERRAEFREWLKKKYAPQNEG